MKGHLLLFILCWIFYAMLTGFNPEEIIIGAAVAVIVSSAIQLSFTHGGRTGYWKAFLGISAFIPYYIFEEVKANIKVMGMIVTGKINPGFVGVTNHHKNEWGATALANSITMTPGTLTVDTDDKMMVIHCLDKKIKKKDVSGGFDHFIRKIWV